MKHLDAFETTRDRMLAADVASILPLEDQAEWRALAEADRDGRIRHICEQPLDDFSVVYRLYFRLKWLQAFEHCAFSDAPAVLEIGSGESDMIPQALCRSHPGATYITANMNKLLTSGLRRKTAGLPIHISVVEDDAMNILDHLPRHSVDCLVLEHSANDILQAILAEQNGLDTTHTDWFALLPEMISLINQCHHADALESTLKQPFLKLLSNCLETVKPGGHMIISHYMFQYDLQLGYDPTLWQDMLCLIRPWIRELTAGAERTYDGFDPQWWLFFQKIT